MSLRASKLEGITADDNASATELLQKKKDIEKPEPPPIIDKENLLEN